MRILITGAKDMVGQALVANLKNLRDEEPLPEVDPTLFSCMSALPKDYNEKI